MCSTNSKNARTTPKNPSAIPTMVFALNFTFLKNRRLKRTTQMGLIAPTTAPKPLGMYTTDNTLKPLLTTNIKTDIQMILQNWCLFGTMPLKKVKKATYIPPPIKWRSPDNCNAGKYLTPTFEAIQVVPHNIETKPTAKSAFDLSDFSAVDFNVLF